MLNSSIKSFAFFQPISFTSLRNSDYSSIKSKVIWLWNKNHKLWPYDLKIECIRSSSKYIFVCNESFLMIKCIPCYMKSTFYMEKNWVLHRRYTIQSKANISLDNIQFREKKTEQICSNFLCKTTNLPMLLRKEIKLVLSCPLTLLLLLNYSQVLTPILYLKSF